MSTEAAEDAGDGGAGFLIVADDLTGALDTAGSLASPAQPFDVPLGASPGCGPRIAIDTDSRDLGQADAERRVADIVHAWGQRDRQIVFKKIDSVMRGHPIAETAAAFRAGGFDRVLLAPAFPDLGRVTRNGQQFVVGRGGASPVGPFLPDAVRAFGLRAVSMQDIDRPADVVVVDAEDNASLAASVARMQALGGRTLFAGSAGLARALGRSSPPIDVPGLDVAVCGTAHPVTLAQVRRLDGSAIRIQSMDAETPFRTGFPVAYVAPETVVLESAARPLITRSIAILVETHQPPRTALMTGGWTLRTLLEQTQADRLRCIGLHRPGVPVSFVVGGRWDGTVIVSKSGGFGGPDFLRDLFSRQPDAGDPYRPAK